MVEVSTPSSYMPASAIRRLASPQTTAASIRPIGTNFLRSDECLGTRMYEPSGWRSSPKFPGVRANALVVRRLLASRYARTFPRRSKTGGSRLISEGDASFSHRHQRSCPLMNSSACKNFRTYGSTSWHSDKSCSFSAVVSSRKPPSLAIEPNRIEGAFAIGSLRLGSTTSGASTRYGLMFPTATSCAWPRMSS